MTAWRPLLNLELTAWCLYPRARQHLRCLLHGHDPITVQESGCWWVSTYCRSCWRRTR